MFDNKKKKYSELLNLELEEFEEFLKRYSYFLKGQDNITKKSVENGLFILDNIIEKKKRILEEQQRYKTKNLIILKYKKTIVDLYENKDFGYLKISNYLKINHNEKISKDTIANFIKTNGIKKNG
jgi:hypothetical protein